MSTTGKAMKQNGLRRLLTKLTLSNQVKQENESEEIVAAHLSENRDSYSAHRLPILLPILAQDQLNRLIQEGQDYQIVHGGLLKAVLQQHDHPCASARVVGVSLHPSPFPKGLFEEACQLQTIFQELYAAVSNDRLWLREVLRDIISTDPLTAILWSVFEKATIDGGRSNNTISAGIFRSDYMVHAEIGSRLQLKQVELNTVACAGAAHGQRVANTHRHLSQTGIYNSVLREAANEQQRSRQLSIPASDNIAGIVLTLETAHHAYVRQHQENFPGERRKVCILMIVQPHNFNIADERPIEYALWSQNPPIPCFRLEWGEDILEFTRIDVSGVLLFDPLYLVDVYEVSVIYFRAGFEPHEYSERLGYDARVRLETSSAIKCPDILTHLVGSKKVQQALCMPGMLERFVDADNAVRLRQSFMQMYPLDLSELGVEGKRLATNPESAKNFVLKPSRDGGGHNIYRENICSFLQRLPEDRWAEYVLMEMIEPVVGRNALVSSRGVWQGSVVAELGIWGGCIWRRREREVEFLANRYVGWSVRSKNPQVDEMSVVKGYGCFDSLALIDDDDVVQAVRVS